MTEIFLTAEWRYLAMLNYRVPQELLLPHVPMGTELDLWQGAAYVSVVGFHFRHTRIARIAIPFHTTFEEVNLRFYVRRAAGGQTKRGVTFIREFVPRRAIAIVAKLAYNEPYRALRMAHRIDDLDGSAPAPHVAYRWKAAGVWSGISLSGRGQPTPLEPGSEEEFVTQHYWGYTRQQDGGTIEYEVRHPGWKVWQATNVCLDGDLSAVFPRELLPFLRQPPHSAFLADGSAVSVLKPVRIGV